MYRLLPLALCMTASVAAPQSSQDNTNVTYVKIQPDSRLEPESKYSSNEARVKNVSITTPGIHKDSVDHDRPQPEKLKEDNTLYQANSVIREPEKISTEDDFFVTALPDPVTDQPASYTDFIASESKQSETIAKDVSVSDDTANELASESRQSDRHANTDTTPSYEENITVDDELVTDSHEQATVTIEETTKAPSVSPRLLPKLSHFGKSTFGFPVNNLMGGSGKRTFKSKCKCEKIWNCAKLQISVPRCPEEYFLCCS